MLSNAIRQFLGSFPANRIIDEVNRLAKEHLTPHTLRNAKKFTQAQLADTLNAQQVTISNKNK